MIDFACKEFNIDEIIKCGLGITKAEYKILNYFTDTSGDWHTTEDISNELKLNLSTIQRGVKKLHEKDVLERAQNNLSGGGYTFVYKIKKRKEIRKLIIDIIHGWVSRVESEIQKW